MKSGQGYYRLQKKSTVDQLGASLSYDVANKKVGNEHEPSFEKLTKSYTFNMNASFATYAYQFDENGNVVVGDHLQNGLMDVSDVSRDTVVHSLIP